jgi:hypothetical protein
MIPKSCRLFGQDHAVEKSNSRKSVSGFPSRIAQNKELEKQIQENGNLFSWICARNSRGGIEPKSAKRFSEESDAERPER